MNRLTRDGTAEPVSLDQILRHIQGQGNIHFPCSADHEQDWQPYPVDLYSVVYDDHTRGYPGNLPRGFHQDHDWFRRLRLPTDYTGVVTCLLATDVLSKAPAIPPDWEQKGLSREAFDNISNMDRGIGETAI